MPHRSRDPRRMPSSPPDCDAEWPDDEIIHREPVLAARWSYPQPEVICVAVLARDPVAA